ncbi:hypothetical protein [Paenibacillus sp. FSL H8-0537]
MQVTEEHIREAMKNASLQTQQKAVSLPARNFDGTKRLVEKQFIPVFS